MADNNYILAMYDVRGKQDYIFRGQKLKEIVGGSLVIRDIFKDELYPAAKQYVKTVNKTDQLTDARNPIFNYKEYEEEDCNTKFTKDNFEDHLQKGYIGEVIYDGGGNFFILYKDRETYIGINNIFTRRVMEKTYSLVVLCSCIEGVDFDNFTTICQDGTTVSGTDLGDREKLYLENRKREAKINVQMPAQVLPFTWVDYANSLPLYEYENSIKALLSKESYSKYQKYKELSQSDDYNEKILDRIVTKKGEDSWIAIMYIDGNNMGAKVQGIFNDDYDQNTKSEIRKVSYDVAVKKLRDFSEKIQKDYIDDRLTAIDEALKAKYQKKDSENGSESNNYKRRIVIYAGDEVNIILNAHDVYDAAKAYFKDMPEDGSACAGIAIFKSHTPYADAYQIAEECCENCKKLMKEHKMGEVNLLDFHYCQGAIGYDLESIRKRECGDIISKPWFVGFKSGTTGDMEHNKIVICEMINQLAENLNTCSRTNIKGLLDHAKNSESKLLTELTRMQLRRNNGGSQEEIIKIKDIDGKDISTDLARKMIYDIVSVYDLWFRKSE